MRSTARFFRPAILLASTALTLSGCIVRPEPISGAEHLERARTERAQLYTNIPPLTAALTLDEAVARALKYNYDARLAMMETALQNTQLTLANLTMLPRLAADAGYSFRDEELATNSISVLTRRQSLEPSTSLDNERFNGSIGFTWNILDFGLSYFQARQQADRTLIAVERRRRVINNMIRETRQAFYRASTAERLLPLIDPILLEAENALTQSAQAGREGVQTPREVLEYQKSILQIVGQIKRLRSELGTAKAQLAALIGLPPGSAFKVAPLDSTSSLPRLPNVPRDELEIYGLTLRPELREEVYQERIDRQGIYREIARMFPGVSLTASTNYDSNSYLYFNRWNEAGVRATWNLLGLVQAPTSIETQEAIVEVSKARRAALSVAVLSQINVAVEQFRQADEVYKTSFRIASIEEQIATASRRAAAADLESPLQRIRRSAESVAAQLDRDQALAQLQGALANVYLSIGVDPLPVDVSDVEIGELRRMVGISFERIGRGDLPPLEASNSGATQEVAAAPVALTAPATAPASASDAAPAEAQPPR